MGGKASRDKGSRGERELFALLSDRLGIIVTRNEEERIDIANGRIDVLPAWRFLLSLPETQK